ncbi:hypothetical protein [Brachybacterium sp. p3-SID957]|uniref:hypothetical protein n=1 Tax=Brachybacterium sp. p3-SID957 TaxID=2916049 RepID=UPI00223B7E69|nr:hypothetical protein [Brachybacterium sp. p3-SID957]MCT1776427.1 hypothetical protein [Brachybacterium sp. p3-SID957]
MDPLGDDAPCAAWSQHAAELAVPLAAELQAWPESPTMDSLVADGYLQRIVPGVFVPPDVLSSALRRALLLGAAIGPQLRSHHVIAGESAAWVILGGTPPAPARLLTPAHRSRVAGVRVAHASFSSGDVETVGGAPVTSPVRTALDLLRFADATTAARCVRALLESGHVTEAEVEGQLHSLGHYYLTRTAHRRLEALLTGTPPLAPPAPAQEAESGAAAETGLPSAVTR